MKRRELLKLAPVVAVAAAVPSLAKTEKQIIVKPGIGNPERLYRYSLSENRTTSQYSDDRGETWSEPKTGFVYMTPEYLKAQEELNQWTTDQLRVLKSRKGLPLKINKIS